MRLVFYVQDAGAEKLSDNLLGAHCVNRHLYHALPHHLLLQFVSHSTFPSKHAQLIFVLFLNL